MIKIEHNVTTGEIRQVEMTKQEVDQRKLDEKEAAILISNQAEKFQLKAELLTRLGITAEEAKLLLE
jgi:hypothetical protein